MKLFLGIFAFLTFLASNANAYFTESSLANAAKKEVLTPAKAYELRMKETKQNNKVIEPTISAQAQEFHNSFKKNITKPRPIKNKKSGGGVPSVGSGMFVK